MDEIELRNAGLVLRLKTAEVQYHDKIDDHVTHKVTLEGVAEQAQHPKVTPWEGEVYVVVTPAGQIQEVGTDASDWHSWSPVDIHQADEELLDRYDGLRRESYKLLSSSWVGRRWEEVAAQLQKLVAVT